MSEKDAHLAWLEATSEGNIHTKSTIDRLRKERRDLLLRMKEEVRYALKNLPSFVNLVLILGQNMF